MKAALTAYLFYLILSPTALWATAAAQESEPLQKMSWTPPGVVLEGVIVASNPDASVALVRRQGASRGRSVQVGKSVFGMSLVEVSEEAALFERQNLYSARAFIILQFYPTTLSYNSILQ